MCVLAYHCLSLSLQMSLVFLHGLDLGQSLAVLPVHNIVSTLAHILQAQQTHHNAAATAAHTIGQILVKSPCTNIHIFMYVCMYVCICVHT